MTLRPGDRLPELPLLRPDGTEVPLSGLAAREATLLIYLRHLG